MPETLTKERPILFTDELVRAILQGRKTQTRRPVKDQCADDQYTLNNGVLTRHSPTGFEQTKAKFSPGDHLWVREAWQHECGHCDDPRCGNPDHIYYRATDPSPDTFSRGWRPSIHMPKWASRITLEVTGVRVERLQDISDADAKAEGMNGSYMNMMGYPPKSYFCDAYGTSVRKHFADKWNQIYKPPFTWAENPYVWVVEFRRLNP